MTLEPIKPEAPVIKIDLPFKSLILTIVSREDSTSCLYILFNNNVITI